jgi:Transglycosylase SLT domain
MDLASVIQTYLVDVKYRVDNKELRKFQSALDDGAKSVEKSLGSIQGAIAKFGVLVIGAYAAVGYAAYKISTQVAESELNFQLLGMRMFMSTTAAKEMTIALEALGHTMDEVAWNKELQGRFVEMIEVQERLRKNLGLSYYEDMKRIRDFSQQVNILQMTLTKYALPAIVDKVFKSFAEGMGLTEKLKEFNKQLQTKEGFDAFVNKWSKIIIPILKSIEHIFVDLGTAFIHFIGLLSGDEALKHGELSFENFGKAIGHVADGVHWLLEELNKFIDWMERHPTLAKILIGGGVAAMVALPLVGAFTAIGGAISSVIGVIGTLGAAIAPELAVPLLAILATLAGIVGTAAMLSSNKEESTTDNTDNTEDSGKKSGPEKGWWERFKDIVVPAGLAYWGVEAPPKVSELNTSGEPVLTPYAAEPRPANETPEEKTRREVAETQKQREDAIQLHGRFKGASDSYRKSVENLIYAAATKFQLPKSLMFSMVMQEDASLNPYAVSPKGAAGIGQLMPDTAALIGVRDRFDPAQSVYGMAKYLAMMRDKFGGNLNDAIMAYNAGPGGVERYEKTGQLPDETRDYVRSVTERANELNVGGITINITQPNATKEQIVAAVIDALDKKMFKGNQRTLAMASGPFK